MFRKELLQPKLLPSHVSTVPGMVQLVIVVELSPKLLVATVLPVCWATVAVPIDTDQPAPRREMEWFMDGTLPDAGTNGLWVIPR